MGVATKVFPDLGFEFKCMVSMAGDYSMIAGSRFNAETFVASGLKVWPYHFDVLPPGSAIEYGVRHSIEPQMAFQLPTPSYPAAQM
ncbi:hypothetical protein BP6252_12526 [Coleophoma cylindrospora]|uniref:Uncharacterized protein n=1 Tax=Coleophoma cylindrospora TaxID=1849047 RepID=A0A3D8QCC9_9HELO|nr:hypothetical protein BP6252_12526 [Coleophoma cylindrospora]